MAGLLALVAVGVLVTDLVTYAALRTFLVARVDSQLEDARAPVAEELFQGVVHPSLRRSSKTVIPDGTYAQLLDAHGSVVATLSSFREASDPRPRLPRLDLAPGDGERRFEVGAMRGSLRYRGLATPLADGAGTLVVTLPLREVHQTLGRLVAVEAVVTVAVLVGLGVLARWVVRIGLRPLEEIGDTARAIAGGDLSRRVDRAEPETEVGRLGAALNVMLGQIEEAFSERRDSEDRLRRFVADASHELRTPLTSIRGYAELFRQGAAERPEDLAVAMRRIEEEAARMGVLVDDLLLLARLDQGRPLERAPVDLVEVASDAVSDARAVAPARVITFDHDGPVVVEGDEGRLRQVVANLLDNAHLHTPADAPVHVRVATDHAHHTAVLEVADEGEGMEKETAARVFERFFRGDASRNRSKGGSGLGLSIVAAIAEAHGGSASVDSAVGQGTTFRVAVPLVDAAPPATSPG